MSSRRTHSKAASGVVDDIVAGLMQPLATLSNTPCPTCGQRTLMIEYTQRSGVTLYCTGLELTAREADANGCTFCRIEIFTTENELPNVTLAPEVKP
jgi:predicted RNA-binding Zn-ribbon protein involved in translation (DUF1610 family)